jgi:sulfide:quinone oxidoreductase
MSTARLETPQAHDPTDPRAPTRHHEILIVGGGTGGITVAAQLARKTKGADIAVVEPSERHFYQPLWTLVGAGVVGREASARAERDFIPSGTTWIQDSATGFAPEDNAVMLANGGRVTYDYLVVAIGLQCNWSAIAGLEDALGREGVVSNYSYDLCEETWKALRAFKGGDAVFTMPPPPIKCAGAPQKIMYLADDHMRKTGVRDRSRIHYYAGTPGIFSVKAFAATLNDVVARKQIETHFKHNLTAVRPDKHEAVFTDLDSGEEVIQHYDLLHVTPPQGPPDVIKGSALGNEAGWVDVDKHSLRHTGFPNVFSLGDVSSCPTSKTGAAVRKEAPVLVNNLLAVRADKPESSFKSYDGYASCPLTTGYGKLVLAEFDYDLEPAPTFPFDTTKERWSMYQLKRYGLPALYWHVMLKGRG